ncbi:hypothetical protein [Streptomyces sp. DSM 40750]|uniref:hypothetical protein n=1 Tax=Streptomyces sp. DSM 40750 TaxID=2801030 RepID=UPI00214BE734|nr:hypothetical protein [Streptomyces sp. DSM 40750]UUU19117.1 hypothetical protein JIX55_01540 [Streptomyces sp. DSM 40750]UUU27539.1 hypothetical protein JIX55_49205 [Streptomyces sp. DSM 40750]
MDINRIVERVDPDSWDERNSMELNDMPRVLGKPGVPVMSMHTIDDWLVPLSMQQTYTKRVAANGQSGLLVNRGLRSATHCGFSDAELSKAWKDLTSWVERKKVASLTFGCRFIDPEAPATPTSESRKLFPACLK